MKLVNRRRRHQMVYAGILAVIGVINLLFFLVLYRPARSEFYSLESSIERQRVEIQRREQELVRLEQLSAQLATSEHDRQELLVNHLVPRDTGYSEVPLKLERMAEAAGVRKSVVSYAISEAPQYGLYSVRIRMPLEGDYSSIANLIKSLETSDTFFILDSIEVRGNPETAFPEVSSVSLLLNLEMFFYQ